MEWEHGFSAEYYITDVDPITWRDTIKHSISGGSIKKESSGLMQSADIQKVSEINDNEHWIRIWLNTYQNGAISHTPLFTGLACAPESKWEGFYLKSEYECYSVVKPCDDVLLPRGWFAAAGSDGVQLIIRLLKSTTPAPIDSNIEDAPRLKNAIIAENNESYLSMAHKIAKACQLRIKINGMGEIAVEQTASESSLRLEYNTYDIVESEIEVEHNWYSCPNVFRAIEDDLMAEARDDSDDSELSTVNRGREIWMEESDCNLSEGETIAEYAKRRLKEEQSSEMLVKYKRRFVPDIEPTDIIELYYPELDINGTFEIKSQTITIGYGATVAEEVTKTWRI